MARKQTGKKIAGRKTTGKRNVSKTKINENPQSITGEIHNRAYEIYLQRGDAPGDALSDWLTAEKDIKKKYSPA